MRDNEGGEGKIRSDFAVVLNEQPAGEPTAEGGRLFSLRFTRIRAGVFINDKPLTGKGGVVTTAMLNDLKRNVTLNVEMDGEGNPTRSETNFGGASREARTFMSNLSDQVLQSLMVLTVPLPGDTLAPLKTWKAQRLLEVGPMSMALPAQANLKFTYLGVRERAGQKEALVHVDGVLRGQRGADNVAGSVGGTLVLSAETGQVISASTTLKLDMDAKYKNSSLKMNGELAVTLKRSATAPPPPKVSGKAPAAAVEAPADKGKDKAKAPGKADVSGMKWIADANQMEVPDAPIAGKLLGGDFKPDKVNYAANVRVLSLEQGQGDASITIFLGIKRGEKLEDKTFMINARSKRGERRPHIHVGRKGTTGGAYI
ncbi:MAG: hypothetical protein ACRELF_26120, partial [Gemmataceae bacterium]